MNQKYEDHPLAVGSATRLRRDGMQVNPFYPSPFQRRKGSIAADLVITEHRKHRCDKNNIFAIVEIKFTGDKIDDEQFRRYGRLLESAAQIKTSNAPVRHQQNSVNSGGRLSLFRYPEDRAADRDDGKPDDMREPRKQAPKKRK